MQNFNYKRKSTVLIMNFFIVIFFFILLVKYFQIQILNHQKYVNKSRRNSIRQVIQKAPRGIIYDRNGIAIVDNRPIFDLQLIPEDVNESFDYHLFSSITKIDSNSIKENVLNKKSNINKFKAITVKRHLSYIEMSRLNENLLSFPGMLFSELPARVYPNNCKLSHTLGYLREVNEQQISIENSVYKYGDIIGTAGLEKQYEDVLRGLDGVEFHMVDKFGRDHGIIDDEIKYNKKSGSSIQLTIDSDFQVFCENLMYGKNGALISMNPINGDILSIVSSPQFDLNSFIGPIPFSTWNQWNKDKSKPLNNRVINGYYSPGSIFKLVTAAMILENPLINHNEKINCSGMYKYYDVDMNCWNLDGHGDVNLNEAIKYSCNVYFYKLIQEFNLDDLFTMSEKMGFNKKTNIDLPNESSGIIPDKKYMNQKYTSRGWAFGNLLNFVIGQGEVITTPIQVVQFMNIIATKGETKEPKLLLNSKSKNIKVNLSDNTWKFIQQSLEDVVNEKGGTGLNTKINEGGIVSGKTGTVENPPNEPHSWFAGYLKTDNNDLLSLAIIVENGGKGSATATPMARKVFEKYISIKQ
ncbi:MAG: penicillin-binding protein 2 [Candidatus Marinimicrobia bacterium]|nr:penicillin-binding protein 2 [Candidatus Neomarinimicrobiota bacterium]|tara:strand:- start:4995 stop:6737 length:1743 start_codon:yes stop_codon:yes gene_type:complete